MLLLGHLFRLVIRPSRASLVVCRIWEAKIVAWSAKQRWGLWLLYTWMVNWNQKRGADIYIYIYIYRCFFHLLETYGVDARENGEHIWMCDRSCSEQPVCCTSGTEVLFRFRPCRWWKMRNQKTAFWRIFNGQRWRHGESSTWQEWRIHAWALFMSRLKAFVLK